ncbi:O-antigen polymerase [Limosilactobacillus panis]|uniref:Oligosaccharide repeat unit polymerase n=1 Tax=Limosilactobacillus panis DSM 6035 TaxID=1423782 RepID=A0A0R1XG44_9LACO|nr:O-antigen polymerase [Limosilactobacillus panis]KRM29064.1 hypothetical protein FD32_GL001546 [Limosilactobacillus panis DSM 6035]
MLSIFCDFILLAFIIIGLLFKEKFYSPTMILATSFFLLFFLAQLRFYGLFKASASVYLIITFGICAFFLGTRLVTATNVRLEKSNVNLAKLGIQVQSIYKILVFLAFVSFFIELVYAIPSFEYIRGGGSLYEMRYNQFAQQNGSLNQNAIIVFLHSYVSVPLLYIELPLSLISRIENKKNLLLVLTTLITFLYFIGNGARMPFIYFVASLVSILLVFFDELKSKKKIRKILVAIIFFVLVINLFTVLRKSGKNLSSDNQTFLQGIYYYLCGSVVNFGIKVPYIYSSENLLGMGTFYGFFTILSNFFNLPRMENANDFFDLIQRGVITISSDSSSPYNFCVTGFLPSYADGKLMGIFLMSFLLGVIIQFVYHLFLSKGNIKWFVMYMLSMQLMIIYVITNLLSQISFCLAIIYTLIFLNSRRKKQRK